MANRLLGSKSPYLRQHAHNPVDWHPWDEQALDLARTTDTPIFLSIGYSACHWCHVMERESFESESIAALLRANFLAIKVDREERPDLDELYMTAVQLMTGSGGWPMSVFLTPDGRPFWGGTYFPEARFGAIVSQLGQAWRERREEVEQVASEISEELRKAVRRRPLPLEEGLPSAEALLAAAIKELQSRFDAAHGGFGGAPKFPPHHALRLLCRAVERGIHADAARKMLALTLEKMACGGLYDHVGGGFHRYSTDDVWLVPHFEKMLYDQALLIRPYAEAGVLLGREGFLRIARETCEWVLRDMTDPSGGFYAALDADSEGEEGRFYVWDFAEAREIAGADFCKRWQIRKGGNWRDEATRRPLSTSIPHLTEPLPDAFEEQTLAAREALRRVRDARPWPLRDEKVLTAWNGLMIGALASAGRALGEPRYLDAAEKAATFCLTTLRPDGVLLHRWADGEVATPAFLDDFAYLADGLLDLADATGEARWREEARSLRDVLLARFWDGDDGGFFFTSEAHETLLARSKDLFDGALPAPNGVAARVLARLKDPHAERLLVAYAGLLARAPQGTATLIEAAALCPSGLHLAGRGQEARPGESTELVFLLSVPEGWHADQVKATLTSDAPAAVGPVQEEGAELRVPVRVASDAAPGVYRVRLTLSLMLCTTDRCLPPSELHAEATVTVQAS